ncbi:multimodular transpeptidase-transglycosylase [Desulfocucumis palustris]|uniref:Penicillin-binding protein 1A n=1 Tax=Desulfocucumis palustris TaxID=1898651 RepID=A0A2L2XGU4_9FIRM|nr:PBP1A family penicillin-binding protein [Desulfocucumis palustris]GBF35589.1 multimodular transpeptidase-transglycosylase [Desulfocucumis palustris]
MKSIYIKIFIAITGFFTGAVLIGLFLAYNYYLQLTRQYDIEDYTYTATGKSYIYSSGGGLISELYDYNRVYVSLDKISEPMKDAIVAIEDHRFYEHFGVDLSGLARALWINYRSGETLQGGSTLTQQLVRNLFLSSEKTVGRKINEIMLAVAFEKRFSKEQILEMYLNEVYFGNGCYGVEAAARRYFNKTAAELDVNEASILAAIPRSPSYYDPETNPEALYIRRGDVLDRMEELGYISHEDKISIRAARPDIAVAGHHLDSYRFPYFTTEVVRQLVDMYGREKVYRGGLKIYTTVDWQIQSQAEMVALESVQGFKARKINATNLAIVSVYPYSGAVAALVGGVDFSRDQNNIALIPRQPGSAIKPLHYAAAMETGLVGPYSLLNAGSKHFGKYFVEGSAGGRVTVRDAIKYSVNVPAVEVVNMLGPEKAIENLKALGVTTVAAEDANLALALGGMTHGIKPLELAAAYVPFASGGVYCKPYLIERVEDMSGKILFRHEPSPRRIYSEKVAGYMNAILTQVITGGTGTRARIPGGAAGKTGTTDKSRCVWFVGYNNALVTAVWAGNTDNTPIGGYDGGRLAAPVWGKYMTGLIEKGFIKAGGVNSSLPEAAIPAVKATGSGKKQDKQEGAGDKRDKEGTREKDDKVPAGKPSEDTPSEDTRSEHAPAEEAPAGAGDNMPAPQSAD